MSEGLGNFFKLIAEDKKNKKEEMKELVGEVDIDSIFSQVKESIVNDKKASQVSNLYNSGVPTDLTTFSPSASHVYRMGDGDTFPTIEDKVGNADQTMTNMASSNFVTDTP